jgi:hypothetical protein
MPVETFSNICAGCISAIVLLIVGACNKPADIPATQPAPATSRPATMPSAAVFGVNGVPIAFDSPRAALDQHAGATRLLIYSDTANASGSFYFEMPIEGASLGDVPLEWEMRIEQKQRADTLIGIEAPDRTLQPVQLAITVRRCDDGLLQITLSGRFQVYAGDSEEPAGEVTVKAAFAAGLVDTAS